MAGIAGLVRAALPAVPGVNQLPGIKKARPGDFTGLSRSRPGVPVDRADVAAYARVCGFPPKDTAPLPYPHLLAFPLHLEIMSDPAFPWPAIGTVHIENSITSQRPVRLGETLDVTTSVGTPSPHAKGVVLDFVTTVTAAGDATVWESTSSYLRRGQGSEPAAEGLRLDSTPPGTIDWRLPADLGRRYARVSGDLNPIHLYPLTARALGFKRQIAHGMWSLARCVAAIENRLPDAVRVEAAFKKPVFLPGTVSFGLEQQHDGWAFALTSPRDESPHLVGRSTSL
ncbi:MaoC/PaaZ C-terminal domain-containing protein [Nocardioides sp. LHG3406-4]|uniref:MaoC/PaaZ C-terminal domain-containing protein n=1 Tax=Nocardioides sp. LHG3406-4 TaxID=2804575 RepID=UPI003CE82856